MAVRYKRQTVKYKAGTPTPPTTPKPPPTPTPAPPPATPQPPTYYYGDNGWSDAGASAPRYAPGTPHVQAPAAPGAPGVPPGSFGMPPAYGPPAPAGYYPAAPGATPAAPGTTPAAPATSGGYQDPGQQYWSDQVILRDGKILIRAGFNDKARSKLKELGFRWENGWWVGKETQAGRRLAAQWFTPQGQKWRAERARERGNEPGQQGQQKSSATGRWYSDMTNWRV